jgi:hypothetical protein
MMTLKGKQERIMTSSTTLPAVILICIIAYFGHSLIAPTPPADDSFILLPWMSTENMPVWLNHLCSLATYIISTYLLVELNNRSDILRVRTSVLIAVFFLFVTFCPELYAFSATKLSLIALLTSLFFLFDSYQCRNSSGHLFHSFAILSIGTLFLPQMMYLIPIWFIGSSMLQSLNLRSFFAAIVGFALPYWFVLSYAFYVGNIDIFLAPFSEIGQFGGMNIFTEVDVRNILSFALFFVLYMLSFAHCLIVDYDNKIRTRVILHFIIFLNICLFLFAILQPMYEVQILNLLLPGICLIVCHYFCTVRSRISYYIFIATLILMLVLFLLKMAPVS